MEEATPRSGRALTLVVLCALGCHGAVPVPPDGGDVGGQTDGPGRACSEPLSSLMCEEPGDWCGKCFTPGSGGGASQPVCSQCDCVRYGSRARWICCSGNDPNNQGKCLPSGWVPGTDVCALPRDPGPCMRAPETRYWHNPATGQCEAFPFTCAGNLNNFASLELCQAACGGAKGM